MTRLVWVTSAISIVGTYLASALLIPGLAGDGHLWWKLATVITLGTLAGAIIPEVTKIFTSTNSRHVREVTSRPAARRASLGILSGWPATSRPSGSGAWRSSP